MVWILQKVRLAPTRIYDFKIALVYIEGIKDADIEMLSGPLS